MTSDEIIMMPAKGCEYCQKVFPISQTNCDQCGSVLKETRIPVSKQELRTYLAARGIGTTSGSSSYSSSPASSSSSADCCASAGSWVVRIIIFLVLSAIVTGISFLFE